MEMTVLAIDDDFTQIERLRVICAHLEYPKVRFLCAENVTDALTLIRTQSIDLVLSDLRLPDGSGIDILSKTKALNSLIPVVIMTAYSDAREAVSILKSGADDYLVKPTDAGDVERIVIRIFEKSTLIREAFLSSDGGSVTQPQSLPIVYRSQGIACLMRMASRCAGSDATVLISGESGTGKELVARFIHDRSPRRDKAFIPVNISALPESLAESELFGHRRGSFTGADTDRIGRFEDANGGTLFIDEIGDVSPALQVKLLRAIQFGIIERVGENTPRELNVRIIAATNHNLAGLVASGRFRKDLFYRINVIDLVIPPLRERKEDIGVLIEHFVKEFNLRNGRSVAGLSREAMDILLRHDFPGNVRELENIIERAVVLCAGDHILARDLPPLEPSVDGDSIDSRSGYEASMAGFEYRLISAALERSRGNKSEAARSLGIGERHLRSRLAHLAECGHRIQ